MADTTPSPAPPASGMLRCVIVTPERSVLDEQTNFIVLPMIDGELGVLPQRAPLVGRLGPGELRLGSGGPVRRFFIDGGFAQVRRNVVTVLTPRAIEAEAIDQAAAAAELQQAQAQTPTTAAERLAKQQAISRAQAQLRITRAK